MDKVNLSAPWYTYVNELRALFGEDEEISIVFDSLAMDVQLFVDNQKKADALTQLLPVEKEFGDVKLKITVIPTDVLGDSVVDLMGAAFEGNPVLARICTSSSLLGSFTYAVFRKEVVQFYNDQLDDINGNKSMLYQDVAKDVLKARGDIFYCTNNEE